MTQTGLTPTASLIGKWKPYPAYKDSGVKWLGEIPEHWEVKRLKNAAQNGFVNGLFKKKDQFGSGTKLVNVVNLYRDNFLIDFESLDRVETAQEEYEAFKVLPGDIFFVRSSLKLEGVGSSASITEIPEPTVFECHIVRQHSIATYLNRETDKIDALISRIRENIEKLKEYSTALISAAVTGKIDVREATVNKAKYIEKITIRK